MYTGDKEMYTTHHPPRASLECSLREAWKTTSTRDFKHNFLASETTMTMLLIAAETVHHRFIYLVLGVFVCPLRVPGRKGLVHCSFSSCLPVCCCLQSPHPLHQPTRPCVVFLSPLSVCVCLLSARRSAWVSPGRRRRTLPALAHRCSVMQHQRGGRKRS